jgi:hypothetical protein
VVLIFRVKNSALKVLTLELTDDSCVDFVLVLTAGKRVDVVKKVHIVKVQSAELRPMRCLLQQTGN